MVDHSERSIALVVEYDPWIRLLLRDLLTDEGYAVLEASNGSTALRLTQRQPPALVLLDLVLPEQSGLELLTELKSTRATAHMPVIAVSAHLSTRCQPRRIAKADHFRATLTLSPIGSRASATAWTRQHRPGLWQPPGSAEITRIW